MEIKKLVTDLTVYEDRKELPAEWYNLLSIAYESAKKAYAPYSRFYVGAAILLENGEIVTGSNQENCAYPSGLCAERTTAFYASAHYPNVAFKKIAIIAINPQTKLTTPVPPCGACRQVLSEYEQLFKSNIEVLFAAEEGPVYKVNSVGDLLPFSFGADFLPAED